MADDDCEWKRILREQVGLDPSKCDPATLDLFKQQFFGTASKGNNDKKDQNAKKDKKEKKIKKSKRNNVVDRYNEDENATLRNRNEKDIHIDLGKASKRQKVDSTEIK